MLFFVHCEAIAEKLCGHVKEAAESPHANYVLTKAPALPEALAFQTMMPGAFRKTKDETR